MNIGTGIATEINTADKIIENTDILIQYTGKWKHQNNGDSGSESKSDEKDASFSIPFTGQQIALYSYVGTENGYAKIVLYDKNGKVILTTLIDMYSKSILSTPVFRSPLLKKGDYNLTVYVTGERPNWSDKRKSIYGSTGNFVALDKIIIN